MEGKTPFAALYAAFALGLAIGVLLQRRPHVERVRGLDNMPAHFWPLPDFTWNEPRPLRDAILPDNIPDVRRLPWDNVLNWPVQRCLAERADGPQCAYMNATGAVHPEKLLKEWSRRLARSGVKSEITFGSVENEAGQVR